MNRGHSVIAGLLAAAVVLLAVNVLVMGSRSAKAHGEAGGGDPYIVKIVPLNVTKYARVWSDARGDFGRFEIAL